MPRCGTCPVDRAAPAAAYLRARSAAPAGRGGRDLPGGRGQHLVHRPLADARRRRAGPRDWASRSCRWRSGARSGSSPPHRPVDLRRGRPVSLLVGPPLYVDPGTDLPGGPRCSGRPCRGCSTTCRPAGAPAARRGGAHPGTPPTSAVRPRRPRRPRSRCRAARSPSWPPSPGPALAGSGRGARAPAGRGSRSGGARLQHAGLSAVSVVIGSTSPLSRRLTGVAASSRLPRTAPAVTARNAVIGSRSDAPPTPAYSAPFTTKPWQR